jgi:hypothetical protein
MSSTKKTHINDQIEMADIAGRVLVNTTENVGHLKERGSRDQMGGAGFSIPQRA